VRLLLGKCKYVIILLMSLVVGRHSVPRWTQMLHHLSLDHVTAAHLVVASHDLIGYFFIQVVTRLV